MTTTTTNRRALLGAIGIAPVAALVAAVPVEAISAPAIDRTAWDQAFGAMERATKAERDFQPIANAAYDGYERDAPSLAMLDMRAFLGKDRRTVGHILDIEAAWADFLAGEGKWWFSRDRSATIAREKASYDTVREYRRLLVAAKRKHNHDAVSLRDEDLSEAAYQAMWGLYQIPAPDLSALHWKLEYLFADGAKDGGDGAEPWAQSVMASLMADVRRLMPKEA